MMGIIFARNYYNLDNVTESEIRAAAEKLIDRLDWEFFIKCAMRRKGACSNSIIAAYRLHTNNKTIVGGSGRFEELIEISSQYMPQEFRKQFIRVLPLIRYLRHIQWLRENESGISKWFAKIFLRLLRDHRLLRPFGLPIEVWSTLGFTDYGIKKHAEIRYANKKVYTLSGALNCFRDEIISPTE